MSRPAKTVLYVFVCMFLSLFTRFAHAAEIRMIPSVVKSDTTPLELKAAKKSGWKCMKKKTDAVSGNPKGVKGAKPFWLKEVKDETDAAETRLEQGKSAVFCTLMVYDKTKHKFANAELGEVADD